MSVDVEALKRLCEQATPGPWKADTGVYEDPDGDNDYTFARGPMVERRGGPVDAWRAKGRADAAFIAAARTALPEALAEIERLTDAKLYGEKVCAELVAERDAALARIAELERERDGARQQCERWSSFHEASLEAGIKEHDSLRTALAAMTKERDEAQALLSKTISNGTVIESMTAERIAQFADTEADAMLEAGKNAPTNREAEAARQEAASLRQIAADIRSHAWKGRTDER